VKKLGLEGMYDYKATRDKVYEIVKSYKILKLKLENRTPGFTNDIKLVFVDYKGVSDPTADFGDWEIETRDIYEAEVVKLFKAFNKLYDDDRRIIKCLLLDTGRQKTSDEVMYELGYSRDSFLVAKKEAIIRFGIALNVEVKKKVKSKAS